MRYISLLTTAIASSLLSLHAMAQQPERLLPASVPAGAVMAFDLPTCPAGWSGFAPATGRAIIGAGHDFDPGYATGDDGQKLTAKNYRDGGGAESHTLATAELPTQNPIVVAQKPGGQPTPVTNLMMTTVDPCLDSGCSQIGALTWGAHPGDGHAEFKATIDTGGRGQPIKEPNPFLALTYCKKN